MERLGVAFTGGLTPPEIVQCVQLAEELGYESAWMAEGHGGDQFSVLTACALATSRIGLGTSISSVFVRSAPTIAMSAACVDYFSGGRFILGLGSSHRVQVGPEHGLPFGQPIPRLRECVDIVRQLLRDGDVSYRGEVFDIQGFDLQFRPLRQEIPIFVAAVFPANAGNLRRNRPGRFADLVHPGTRAGGRRARSHRRRTAGQEHFGWGVWTNAGQDCKSTAKQGSHYP